MARNDTSKVFVGKPKAAGAIFWAAKGTAVPTDASTALPSAFACLGYCSEDGLVETEERETEEVKAWGGDIVDRPQTSYSKQYAFTPIQTDADVLKYRFGAGNVDVDAESGTIHLTHKSSPLPHGVLVAELALGDSMILRKVVPDAQIIEFEDTSYVDGEPIGYGATLAAFDYDGEGSYVEDYYASVADVATGDETNGEG